jgi:hypothetical protein
MSFCCVRRAVAKARGQLPNVLRDRSGIASRIPWIAGIGLAMGAQAWAADRAHLDRCQAQLATCYETCKSQGVAAKTCSERCTTDQCGLPWRETYGAFLDRRIEENAAPVSTAFVGLRRIKGARAQEKSREPEFRGEVLAPEREERRMTIRIESR